MRNGQLQTRLLASCGADGEFLLDHLAPGTWELRIVKRGSSPGLPAAATVEVANDRVEAGDIGVPPS
jgi:hypothetical protein